MLLPRREDDLSPWAAALATLVTLAAFLVLLRSLVSSPAEATAPTTPPPDDRERLTFLDARPAPVVDRPRVRVATKIAAPTPASPAGVASAALAVRLPRDTGVATGAAAPGTGPAQDLRLVPSARAIPGGAWGTAVVVDPFTERRAPAAPVRDSLLAVLRATVPGLARTRVMTPAEHDAAVKEAMLARQLTGRVLLDPVVGDGTYKGGSSGIPLPLFEPGPSRAVRVRDSISFAENRARLERLRRRADSLRAVRDSVPR